MKITIIVDDYEDLSFIDRIISQGCLNNCLPKEEIEKLGDKSKINITYIKSTPEMMKCIDKINKKSNAKKKRKNKNEEENKRCDVH